MEPMGYKNVAKVYEKASQGKLLKRRDSKVWVLDSFALNVLTYMAVNTYDYPNPTGNEYRPSRYYDGGWKKIAQSFGLLSYDAALAEQVGDDTLSKQRENTARTRISRTWAQLIEMGLIRRYKGAYLGENAGYVLMIGDDEENAEVIENAKEIIQ
jgi:hypothetical protein